MDKLILYRSYAVPFRGTSELEFWFAAMIKILKQIRFEKLTIQLIGENEAVSVSSIVPQIVADNSCPIQGLTGKIFNKKILTDFVLETHISLGCRVIRPFFQLNRLRFTACF
ncbi:unnamed protein product [Orchesella dallaii]|uniref:Uncharacterized protein n=1 Tax=Orchesella dallaii TaxID=48710 RepID=A0ABP1RRR8_9HEXA